MPPTEKAKANPKGGGKNKGRAEGGVSTIDFGLPQSMITALQAISARATQDLWGNTAYSPDILTAEQIAQRRSTATGKLSKRIAGNVRAKQELNTALAAWMSQVGQHILGLIGRVRAISSKVDEDLLVAIQEMRDFLILQPSQATSDQVAQAEQSLGPIWSNLQEQEVISIAAALRAFGTVQSPAVSAPLGAVPSIDEQGGLPSNDTGSLNRPLPSHFSMASDQASNVSFGAPSGNATISTMTAPSSRWSKRRTTASGQRPSKSPRRDPGIPSSPWQAIATGLTPEGARRVPSTLIDDDDPELLPAHPQEEHATVPPTWTSAWLCLAAFAVDQGAELVGELITDETQSAILPLHDTNADCASVVQQAEKAWQELRTCVAEHGEKDLFPVCSALAQVLTALRQAPQAVPQVRQGLLIAAHLTVGGLLDPYSYAPATLQEWLYPALLLERRVSCKGYLPSVASSASEVQGLLALPCPFAAHLADARAIGDDQAQEPRS